MRKFNRILISVIIIIMMIEILPLGISAENSLGNFIKTKSFSDNLFTDVKKTDWFFENVKEAYQYGLVKGNSVSTFNPDGNVKLSEAIAIASRLNSIYKTGKEDFVQGNVWYRVYVDYALENGIISSEYKDYNKAATRAEFASIFASALPAEVLEKINAVDDNAIPDVKMTDSFAASVYLLYRAGILVGSDSQGNFKPDSNIKRSEVATIASRMVDRSLRKTVKLENKGEEEVSAAWDTNPYRLYVAENGNDKNDGSKERPFATIEAAVKAVRTIDKSKYTSITVYVGPGEYRPKQLIFDKEDSGTEKCPITYKATVPGTAVISGGVSIPLKDFTEVKSKTVLARLSDGAKGNVVCYDLTTLSLSSKDWGEIQPMGAYSVAEFYEGYQNYKELPQGCEVSYDGTMMTLARYPNEGFVQAGAGSKAGHNATYADFWYKLVHEGDTIALDAVTAQHVSRWGDLENVWLFGYFIYDWADSSTPIESFSGANSSIKTKFVSRYGVKEGAPFYFFNILEELDAEGEWYLDRQNGILYFYPPEGNKTGTVTISTSKQQLISVRRCSYLTFDGFVISDTRNNGVSILGDNNTVKNCIIRNVTGDGIVVEGSGNVISKNEIAYIGNRGVIVTGGDVETLSAGNNIVDNNYIHDWSLKTKTYRGGIELHGVGNKASHNELANAPHMAITWTGNNHIFEYNIIRNVCRLAGDAGAIYCGASWVYYGNIFRYNLIDSPGSDEFTKIGFTTFKVSGFYFDDALSGQTAYGNILLNVPGCSFTLGGGRDLDIYNNIIITTGSTPIAYDSRAIDGITMENTGYSWFSYSRKDGYLWETLASSPWKSGAWQKAFPAMKNFKTGFSDINNPNFIPNPANSNISGNLIISCSSDASPLGYISASVRKYSTVGGNVVLKYGETDLKTVFVSPETGDYTLIPNSEARKQLKNFADIPCSEIGRYDW